MSDLTEETAQELVRALDEHAQALRQVHFPDYSEAAGEMQSAARRMDEAAGTIAMASRR